MFAESERGQERDIPVTENGGGKRNVVQFFGIHFDPLSDTTMETKGDVA